MLIAKYTCNASGVVPTFNAGYIYEVSETENNGVYTVEITSEDDFSSCSFNGNSQLLTVEYLNASKVTTMANMFNNCTNLTSLDVSNWDTGNVIYMHQMFQNCNNLTSLDVSNFDTNKVTNMSAMFNNCTNLTSLDVSNFNTTNVTNMQNMFRGCNNLTSLDVSNFNTTNVTNMGGMFNNCTSLNDLDLSNWKTPALQNIYAMFYNCKLRSLDISNFILTSLHTHATAFAGTFDNIGMLYCSQDSVNQVMQLIQKGSVTIWVKDTKASDYTTTNYATIKDYKEEVLTIQLSEPLRGLLNGVCDKFVKQGGKWYVERNCDIREYQEGDLELSNTLTDTKNTVYQLATPTYEEITDPQVITYLDTTHISNNSAIPCNMKIKNSGYNAIIKPSTQYTVAFDTDKSGEVGINLGGAKVTTTNNVATITTPSALTNNTLRLCGKGIKASNIRLLEGDKTNYIPSYFEGIKSCFEDKEQDNGSYKVEIMSYNKNKSNSIQLQLNEPLRAVGGVKDRLVLKDGKLMIERNCRSVILNGSEDWKNEGTRFWVSKNDIKLNNGKVFSNEYPSGTYSELYYGKINLIALHHTHKQINVRDINVNNIGKFKDKLINNPITITYQLAEPTYEEVPFELQKLILECFENGTLFIDTLIPPTVSVTYSANIPVVSKLNKVNEVTEINTEDIAITQMAVDFLLMSSLGEEMINFKIKGGTNMSAYFASRIIKGALKYEDVIRKYPNYKEDIDLILVSEGYSDLIVEL